MPKASHFSPNAFKVTWFFSLTCSPKASLLHWHNCVAKVWSLTSGNSAAPFRPLFVRRHSCRRHSPTIRTRSVSNALLASKTLGSSWVRCPVALATPLAADMVQKSSDSASAVAAACEPKDCQRYQAFFIVWPWHGKPRIVKAVSNSFREISLSFSSPRVAHDAVTFSKMFSNIFEVFRTDLRASLLRYLLKLRKLVARIELLNKTSPCSQALSNLASTIFFQRGVGREGANPILRVRFNVHPTHAMRHVAMRRLETIQPADGARAPLVLRSFKMSSLRSFMSRAWAFETSNGTKRIFFRFSFASFVLAMLLRR